MKKGIFYNSKKTACSIYESGIMCFNSLKKSNLYKLDYTEDNFYKQDYDFHVFNYHHTVNNWLNNVHIAKCIGVKFCIVLEVGEKNDLLPYTPKCFDKYLIIDPSFDDSENLFFFPRPIENVILNKNLISNKIIVGSFGFATEGKKWIEVIHATKKDFDQALIRINIPFGNFVGDQNKIFKKISDDLKIECEKNKFELELTHEYMNKLKLIKWCSENTINFFPYYRNMSGLAAVTDQAICSGKPILTTNNKTFRHVLKYIKPYPEIGIKAAIEENLNGVIKMKNDWSHEKFYKKFETILFS